MQRDSHGSNVPSLDAIQMEDVSAYSPSNAQTWMVCITSGVGLHASGCSDLYLIRRCWHEEMCKAAGAWQSIVQNQ